MLGSESVPKGLKRRVEFDYSKTVDNALLSLYYHPQIFHWIQFSTPRHCLEVQTFILSQNWKLFLLLGYSNYKIGSRCAAKVLKVVMDAA